MCAQNWSKHHMHLAVPLPECSYSMGMPRIADTQHAVPGTLLPSLVISCRHFRSRITFSGAEAGGLAAGGGICFGIAFTGSA